MSWLIAGAELREFAGHRSLRNPRATGEKPSRQRQFCRAQRCALAVLSERPRATAAARGRCCSSAGLPSWHDRCSPSID